MHLFFSGKVLRDCENALTYRMLTMIALEELEAHKCFLDIFSFKKDHSS